MRLAIDWDGTLYGKDDWLPGAEDALWRLSRRYDVVIWTCQGNWQQGAARVADVLDRAAIRGVEIEPKVEAACYVDDKAYRFEGDWPQAERQIRRLTRS